MACLVFLDFDGVICDSVREGFASSWDAYFGSSHREISPSRRARLEADFLELRPYVRSGEDFMICQEILHQRLEIRSQAAFDALAAAKGPSGLARLGERFYQAREALLRSDRTYWFSLNTLYPGVPGHLSRWAGSPRLHILSTKRPGFIAETLAAAGVHFPGERILYAPRTEKGERIEETMEHGDASAAMLVDDQIDHLMAIRDASSRVAVYLASWGYVKPEWLAESPVPVLGLEELPGLVDGALV